MIKLIGQHDDSELSIEKVIHSLAPNYQENLKQFKVYLEKAKMDEKQRRDLRNKIRFAEARINQKLELSLQIKYFIIPFGMTSVFLLNETYDIDKFREFGYIRKIKEYYKASFFGMFFYIFSGIGIGLWLRLIS